MSRASVTTENDALNSIDATGTPTNKAAYSTLHSGDTSTTGANEFSGSGYARSATSWNAASGGSKTNSTTQNWTTNGTTPATYFGTFSASTGGTFGIGGALSSAVTATTITAAPGSLTMGAS